MLGFIYLVNIYGPGSGLGLQATYQIDAFVLEVISLKTKLERHIGVSGESIVIMTIFSFFFASTT